MNIHRITAVAIAIFTASLTQAQQAETLARVEKTEVNASSEIKPATQKVVVITGARFSYKLVEKWIDEYNKVNPNVQIIVESRGSADPQKYDILAEVYDQGEEIKKTREYINVGRYAILPVATANSDFAKIYSDKGLDRDLIKQIFFHDIFADKEKQKEVKAPYTVYTRLQKAGVPTVFANYFGHEQKDIKGVAIAGADSHLLKALLRDSTGITYLPLPLIYDEATGNTIQGLTVLPVDLNGNGRINDEEKFYNSRNQVIEVLESKDADDIKNIPIEYLHLSVDKQKASAEAVDFLKWVNEHGQDNLHDFGYLKPEADRFGKDKFVEFASKRGR